MHLSDDTFSCEFLKRLATKYAQRCLTGDESQNYVRPLVRAAAYIRQAPDRV